MTVPLVVVPPDAERVHVERILIALGRNGDAEVALALAEQLSPIDLVGEGNEGEVADIVAVHVFDPETLPQFGDDPTFEAEEWAREFLRRASSTAAARVHLDLRVGDPAVQVCEAVRDLDADLVVLAWHRAFAQGHAPIVRRVLETVHVPLVLLGAQTAPTPVVVGGEGGR
jgi:nucleotide-binding universal stress UspA family protein